MQASTKYLHQRLLVVLVSPPLPGIVTQNRRGTTDRASKNQEVQGEGDDESDEHVYDDRSSSSISSSSGGSGSESDGYWSDDDPDRESPRWTAFSASGCGFKLTVDRLRLR